MRWITEPVVRDFGLDDLALVVAMTGHESATTRDAHSPDHQRPAVPPRDWLRRQRGGAVQEGPLARHHRRTGEYLLWGWTREHCHRFLLDALGESVPKSCCARRNSQ